jgi:hypothetical protein
MLVLPSERFFCGKHYTATGTFRAAEGVSVTEPVQKQMTGKQRKSFQEVLL